MSETIRVVRNVETGELFLGAEVVYSPDDNGYYLGETDFIASRRRVSKKIWRTKQAAINAYSTHAVRWEKWR